MKGFKKHYFTEDPKPASATQRPTLATKATMSAVGKDWRERRVWHVTPTGKRNYVMIKSLSPEEQEKYRPEKLKQDIANRVNKIKRKKKEIKGKPAPDAVVMKPDEVDLTLELYYAVDDEKGFDEFEEEKLTKATDSAEKAREWEDAGQIIIRIKNVSPDAIVMYKDDEDEMKHFPDDMKTQEKYDFVKFEENDEFMLDLYPYREDVVAEISDDEEETDE